MAIRNRFLFSILTPNVLVNPFSRESWNYPNRTADYRSISCSAAKRRLCSYALENSIWQNTSRCIVCLSSFLCNTFCKMFLSFRLPHIHSLFAKSFKRQTPEILKRNYICRCDRKMWAKWNSANVFLGTKPVSVFHFSRQYFVLCIHYVRVMKLKNCLSFCFLASQFEFRAQHDDLIS